MRSLGANEGATRATYFRRRAYEYGQADGDHASPRTGPDDAERLTGIYGLTGICGSALGIRRGDAVPAYQCLASHISITSTYLRVTRLGVRVVNGSPVSHTAATVTGP